MPFLTEELWLNSNFKKIYKSYLINYKIDSFQLKINKMSIININFIKNLIISIRSIKSKLSVSASGYIDLSLEQLDNKHRILILKNKNILFKLARVRNLVMKQDDKFISLIVNNRKMAIKFDHKINLDEQKIIIEKKISNLNNKIIISNKKLKNISFIRKAPKDVVDKEKLLHKNNLSELNKLNDIMNSLK